jgi:hypothetical protein
MPHHSLFSNGQAYSMQDREDNLISMWICEYRRMTFCLFLRVLLGGPLSGEPRGLAWDVEQRCCS